MSDEPKVKIQNQMLPRFLGILLLLLAFTPLTAAQETTPEPIDTLNHPWTVFLRRSIDETGLDQLIFVDGLTGAQVEVEAYGERYTAAGQAILYYDTSSRQVMLATPDGEVRPHPFILPTQETRRIDWLVSDDESRIAWTLTNSDASGQLVTITTIANSDGTNQQQALVDGPRNDGLRALPLAFSTDLTALYMDLHPDGLSNFMPIEQYAGVFALNLATGDVTPLPGEEQLGCLCGAGVGAGLFLRMSLSADQTGFDLRVYDLGADVNQVIPAPRLRNYTLAGDMLITDDGTRAVYALAQIANFGSPQQTTRTVFIFVDLQAMTQETLTEPITTFVHPVAWTEDNSTIIFTSPIRDGTWKINLTDRRLERIAEATYIGTLQPLNN